MAHCLAWFFGAGSSKKKCGHMGYQTPTADPAKAKARTPPCSSRQPVMVAFPRCQAMHRVHVCPECLAFVPGGRAPWLTRLCPLEVTMFSRLGSIRVTPTMRCCNNTLGTIFGTSRILNQFLDWVNMYYDVDQGTHQVTPKPAPEEVQPTPARVPGSRHKTATKKPPNPPVEISGHVCKDFSLLGSNAYVMRKTCRDCGRVTQTPRNPTYTQDQPRALAKRFVCCVELMWTRCHVMRDSAGKPWEGL